MATIAVAKVGATLKIDGVEYPLNEGDIVNNMRYLDNGVEKTITGKVRVIAASTVAQNVDPHTSCPPNPYLSRYIAVTGMIIDSSTDKDAILTRITASSITGMDSVTPGEESDGAIVLGPGAQYKGLDEAIAAAEDGAVIKLLAGEYTVPLTLDKSITLLGTVPGVILSGKVDVAGPATAAEGDAAAPAGIDVRLENVKLTGDALVKVGKGVNSFAMVGCRFGGHNMTAKTMPIQVGTGTTGMEPILLTIDNNTFEAQNEFSYNLIDVYGYIKDGSSFSGNVFEDGCCTHNRYSLYGMDEGAVIRIDGNKLINSDSLLRIGFIGAPKGTVYMEGNSYDTLHEDPRWQGMFLVQPYGTKTESFGGLTMYINKTDCPKGSQIGKIYAGPNDMKWTDETKPVIYVDGEKIVIPNASAQA